MKNAILKSLLVITTFIFSSCNKGEPQVVAEKFLTNFYQMNYAEAKTVATDKAKDILVIVEKISNNLQDSTDVDYKNIKVDIVKVEEEKDKAVVTYTLSNDPTERHLNMVKENGEWLANLTKEDNMQEIQEEIDGPIEE
ncbi:MAG: DUF4878 domain-containing protein [Flavipsychrobacter sp.]